MMTTAPDNLKTVLGFVSNEYVRNRLHQSEERIRRAFDELFGGYDLRAEDVLNEVVRVENYAGPVTVQDISFYSFCEHHFAPFFGTASVTYQPGAIITGLGKIVRLVHDVHAGGSRSRRR
jgi:GTP cyclohydrolase I